MSEHHDNHGQTPAAWTAVILVSLGFIVGTVAVILGNWILFWVGGAGLVVLGGVVGKVMSMAGYGAEPKQDAQPASSGTGSDGAAA